MSEPSLYTGYIRFRVGGILEEDGKLLLVKLLSPISNENIWIPPGGGVDFGETCEEALIREFSEETSLNITVHELLHVNEIIEGEFHVIEHFFKVKKINGHPKLGIDPEHHKEEQILSEIGFYSQQQIAEMNCKPEYLKKEYWRGQQKVLFNRQG